MEKALPPIPAKRYFTIGEVGDLCGVKPHVLRYWEQEFTQLRPMKRRGNRRYYQHHEVLMIRRIRELLYEQGFTISGARNKLQELVQADRDKRRHDEVEEALSLPALDGHHAVPEGMNRASVEAAQVPSSGAAMSNWLAVRQELVEIRELLKISI
ncbi:MerR family transcriptional regulator [Hydrogenophaga sp. PAMC20947]|uniref:MerR family transcriptional regulator n=1 Tax=Hydrogenophaga sp. PAMC20947 TaxID=2565558 RepID=UPI00109DBED9|nr:MerR family transcriptional regulator [Hydrogenophaga sp. PAMC20947]QCB45127.1 MerR family transcriptional regulator [Hydrogenophaga sp. PAMC20947]